MLYRDPSNKKLKCVTLVEVRAGGVFQKSQENMAQVRVLRGFLMYPIDVSQEVANIWTSPPRGNDVQSQ